MPVPTPYFDRNCNYLNQGAVYPVAASWRAPYTPVEPPCCGMPQNRNFVEENILWGLESVLMPLLANAMDDTVVNSPNYHLGFIRAYCSYITLLYNTNLANGLKLDAIDASVQDTLTKQNDILNKLTDIETLLNGGLNVTIVSPVNGDGYVQTHNNA